MQYHQQQQINNKKQIKGSSSNMKLIDKGKQNQVQNSSLQSSLLQVSQLQQKRLMTDQSQSQISNRLILFQQLQNSSNCLFCNKCRKSSQFGSMISTALYSKYSASQNYYFTKDINDILAGTHTSAVIRLKDVQTYDDEEEFLNRLYLFHEYDNKIKRLTEYYKFHRDIARLFMIPITSTLNKYHDKKRRLYYIQITRMLKEKENQGQKEDKSNIENDINIEEKERKSEKVGKKYDKENKKDDEFKGQMCEIQKNKNTEKDKDEKDFNIKDKSNGADLLKSFDMNERFLAPLDDLDEQTKSVQYNTLQDLNNKLNDILMNSTRSMQSYLLDQDVSQSIGNLSNFLNHLKIQNSQQQISIPQQKESNSHINFNPQQFQNLLLNQDQKNISPMLLKNQIPSYSLQPSEVDNKNPSNLIANSQNIKQFLKKDSFLKKSSNQQQYPTQQKDIQQSLPFSSSIKLQTENSLLQQMLKNNSPQSNQNIGQELQKQNLGSKTDRGHYNQKNDEKVQNSIQKINQDMIQLNKQKIQPGSQSAYNSIGNKEGQQKKEFQNEQTSGQNNSNQQSKNIVLSGNQIQLAQFDDKHVQHLKTQSLNQGGFIIYQDHKGNSIKAGNLGKNNQGISNQKSQEKNSARQSVKDGKNYEYPMSGMTEINSGKQSQNQSIERNSLQQSINGIIKQASKVVGSQTSSAESSQIGLQTKLVSNANSKYSSSQNIQDSKQSVQQNQQTNNTKTQQLSKQSDHIVNKKINNLVLSDHQSSKNQQIQAGGKFISQISIPTNSIVQQIILSKQSSQTKSIQDQKDKSDQDKSYHEKQKEKQFQDKQQNQQNNQQNQQENQKSLSQQLSQQFQMQFSQQLQNYQRSQIQELQQQQRQFYQGIDEYKNDVDGQCAPFTDRSQYTKKNNSQNLGYQKTLSARDKEQTSKGQIDLNAYKLKTQEAIQTRRDNQFDIQVSYLRNNTDNNQTNYPVIHQNDQQTVNPSQNQIKQVKNFQQQNEFKNIQQNTHIQNLIQGNVVKSSLDNIKSYSNLVNFGKNNQHVPTHVRTQTLESYRESNLNSQENTQSNTQSQQASRNQSKNKNQILQQYPLPPTSQFGNQSQIQSNNQAQLSRQNSQQKNQISSQNIQNLYQQQQSQNEDIYFKHSNHDQNNIPLLQNQLRMESSNDLNQIQNRSNLINSSKQNNLAQQSHNNQIYLKKSLSNYKFENIGELKQMYKEVSKRTADMIQKNKDVQKTAQNTAIISSQSIQEIQYQKANTQRQKNSYYTKADLTTHKKGSLTQRGFQNSQEQSSSKEISPRVHRIQKSDQSHLQNNSLLKFNTDREQNTRRLSSQIKSSSNFNNSSSQILPITGQVHQQYQQQSQPSTGGSINKGVSQLLMASQQIQQHSREQALTTTQKKLQYKQQASKNSSEINHRMIHSNPNVEFNKASHIQSYNNSVNNTNIFAPQNQYQPINHQTTAVAQSEYSSMINNFGSNSQVIGLNNTSHQNNTNSQQNSSKKILDKIKHTRINSMKVTSLQQSSNNNQSNTQLNFKSSIPSQTYRQQSTEYGTQIPLNLQDQQQIQSNNPSQFLITGQNNTNQKKIHHKYNKSEADSLTQLTQQQNISQNIISQTNLGQNKLMNINQNGNKYPLQKQVQQLQGNQNQYEIQNSLLGLQQTQKTQQLLAQPSSQQFINKANQIGIENERIAQQMNKQAHQMSQNIQSPERNQYNSTDKKDNQQYITYANNNIINIYVNSNQENDKTIQSNNLINNNAQNFQQNIHQMVNTQININKNEGQTLLTQAQKIQNSPQKMGSKLLQNQQHDNYNNLKH